MWNQLSTRGAKAAFTAVMNTVMNPFCGERLLNNAIFTCKTKLISVHTHTRFKN